MRPRIVCPIRGNWHLSGSWDSHRETPHLTLSLGVIGDKILGMGSFAFSCPGHGPGLAIGLIVEGQISEDGTFLLLEPKLLESQTDSKITISGEIPKSGSDQWAGMYSFSRYLKDGECSAGADFVATKLPLLGGVYSGTLRLLDRSEVAVDLKQR